MLLLNTKFAVSPDLTRQALYDLMKEWLRDSHFCDESIRKSAEDFKWDMETFQFGKEDNTIQVYIDNYEDAFVIQVVNTEDDCVFKTNYVLRDKDGVHMLQCVQDKSVTSLSVQDSKKVRLPKMLRSIFWNEYCGYDHGLSIDDKAFVIRKNDIDLAASIVNQSVDFDMPVIYVSPDDMSRYSVNYEILASEMLGQAHVVLEGSPVISNKVRELSGESKPYGGAIRVYLPNKQTKLYRPLTPEQRDQQIPLHYAIINDVRDMQAAVAVADIFNVEKLRQKNLFSKLSKEGDSELVELCESMINDKDREIESLKEELQSTKQKLAAQSSKADALQMSMDREAEEDGGQKLVYNMTEKPFYDGEFEDVILRVLKREYDAMKGDSNLSASRKFHVLEDVLEHNFPCGTDAKLVECIKSAVKSGTLSKDGIGRLQDAGFTVKKEGRQAHYKVKFNDDERYVAMFAATPSDSAHGAKNFVSDFTNKLFGY